MKTTPFLVLLLFASPTAGAQSLATAPPDTAARGAFVQWATRKAATLHDSASKPADGLRSIAAIARGARVVAVGETQHYRQEFLEIRREILRYLVEQHRVMSLAMETGLPEARRVNAWIVGET